jgi:hypothetical protein
MCPPTACLVTGISPKSNRNWARRSRSCRTSAGRPGHPQRSTRAAAASGVTWPRDGRGYQKTLPVRLTGEPRWRSSTRRIRISATSVGAWTPPEAGSLLGGPRQPREGRGRPVIQNLNVMLGYDERTGRSYRR